MPLFIEQQAGRKRSIVLDGRGLPNPDGVRWGTEQRAEVTWLPGSPDAVAQFFGPKQKDMTITGRWGDAVMSGGIPTCVVKVDGRQYTSAMEAAQLLDLVCAEGILLRVQYESEVRYGYLKNWEYGPFAQGRTTARVDWQATFEWLSRGARPAAPALPNQMGTSTLSNRLAILVQQVEATYDKMTGVADELRDAMSNAVGKLRSIADTANQTAYSWVQRAASAADTAQATIGLTGEVAAAAGDLYRAAQSTIAAEAAALQAGAEQTAQVGGLQIDPPLGTTLTVARDARDMVSHARDLADLADAVRAQTEAALAESEPQIVYARRGEDLRDIAQQTLGSADAWRDIAAQNGLVGSEVEPGTPILIPARSQRQLATR